MANITRTERVLRQTLGQPTNQSSYVPVEQQGIASIGSEPLILPNHSGDLSAGKVMKTPVNPKDPVNKNFVDSNYVPYLNALTNVDLGNYHLKAPDVLIGTIKPSGYSYDEKNLWLGKDDLWTGQLTGNGQDDYQNLKLTCNCYFDSIWVRGYILNPAWNMEMVTGNMFGNGALNINYIDIYDSYFTELKMTHEDGIVLSNALKLGDVTSPVTPQIGMIAFDYTSFLSVTPQPYWFDGATWNPF